MIPWVLDVNWMYIKFIYVQFLYFVQGKWTKFQTFIIIAFYILILDTPARWLSSFEFAQSEKRQTWLETRRH